MFAMVRNLHIIRITMNEKLSLLRPGTGYPTAQDKALELLCFYSVER